MAGALTPAGRGPPGSPQAAALLGRAGRASVGRPRRLGLHGNQLPGGRRALGMLAPQRGPGEAAASSPEPINPLGK